MRDAVIRPLGCDERGHGYRPIASDTQRATLRLRTSHLMASSAFSLRSRASSARSSSLSAPSPSPRRRRSAFTQLPSVPSLIPRSRATCAIGLPVSLTSRTAPALKSLSTFLRVAPMGELLSLKRISRRWEGKPTTDPNRTWSGQELAAQLQIKLHNLLTQLAEWSRLGFLAHTDYGTYALNTRPGN